MHHGEAATLADAIRVHYAAAEQQSDERLKQAVSDAEIADLVAFLGALTDEGFISNPKFALPLPACPVDAPVAQLRDEANSAQLHNNMPGP